MQLYVAGNLGKTVLRSFGVSVQHTHVQEYLPVKYGTFDRSSGSTDNNQNNSLFRPRA